MPRCNRGDRWDWLFQRGKGRIGSDSWFYLVMKRVGLARRSPQYSKFLTSYSPIPDMVILPETTVSSSCKPSSVGRKSGSSSSKIRHAEFGNHLLFGYKKCPCRNCAVAYCRFGDWSNYWHKPIQFKQPCTQVNRIVCTIPENIFFILR